MKKIFGLLLVCTALIGVLFPWAKAEGAEGADRRKLRISATVNAEAGFTNILLEQGNYKELSFLNLENVTIDLDGNAMKLEDALREGRITPDTLAWENVEELQNGSVWAPPANGPLTMEGTTQLSFDFEDPFGSLSAGEYMLTMEIVDHYDASEVHPLMHNYRDTQWYSIEFTIQ